jgi:N-dimethylarginine dimethylaminohydrolase
MLAIEVYPLFRRTIKSHHQEARMATIQIPKADKYDFNRSVESNEPLDIMEDCISILG